MLIQVFFFILFCIKKTDETKIIYHYRVLAKVQNEVVLTSWHSDLGVAVKYLFWKSLDFVELCISLYITIVIIIYYSQYPYRRHFTSMDKHVSNLCYIPWTHGQFHLAVTASIKSTPSVVDNISMVESGCFTIWQYFVHSNICCPSFNSNCCL